MVNYKLCTYIGFVLFQNKGGNFFPVLVTDTAGIQKLVKGINNIKYCTFKNIPQENFRRILQVLIMTFHQKHTFV